MLTYLFDFINLNQLEILGVPKHFIQYILLLICSLVISIFIYFNIVYLIRKGYFIVLFYVISSGCFILLSYILSIKLEFKWHVITMMELVSIYGCCFFFYLLLRTFIHRYNQIR